ncbi:Crp/Fnr family transcriptional regulator [Chloroflexota bacterium]
MTKLEVLKKCPFVRELDDEQLEILAKMCHEEVFEVGESLTRQGETQEKIYLIEDGLVGIYLELGPMNQRQIQPASNFDVVGWASLLSPYRASGTLKAIETTKALAFTGQELIKLCEDNAVIGNKIHRGLASLLAGRLRNAFAQLMGVTVQDQY